MKHTYKNGSIGGLTLLFLAIVVIAIVGIGWMWHKGGVVATNTQTADVPNTGTDTSYTYTIATSTGSAVSAAPTATTHTVTTYVTKTVPAAPNGLSGTTYHNSTYGLTLRLPSAGWTTYQTASGPAGLPGTAQIHFVAPGESQDAFVINVWSKAGWNYVRTNENYVHLNTNNIGEGTYLGENFTWIYSYTLYSHPEAQPFISGAVFY